MKIKVNQVWQAQVIDDLRFRGNPFHQLCQILFYMPIFSEPELVFTISGLTGGNAISI